LDTKITDERFSIFSNGNAGSGSTKFFSGKNNLQHLDLDLIYGDSWNHDDEDIKKENRRKRCAEVLIYPFVPTSDIIKIICPNQKMNNHAKELVIDNKIRSQKSHIEIETNPFYFF
jgi:hypothetical protein